MAHAPRDHAHHPQSTGNGLTLPVVETRGVSIDSKLDSNARIALAVTVLLTIASAMLNPYGLDVLSLPFKTIGTSDVATVAVPELKPMFSIVPVEAVILIVISVVPVIFHAKCLGFKKAVFSFETMMISGLLFLSLMTWRNATVCCLAY